MSAPVPPPPADDERIPPLTAQQLGLCGPRSDDTSVGPDAARHTPPAARDEVAKLRAIAEGQSWLAEAWRQDVHRLNQRMAAVRQRMAAVRRAAAGWQEMLDSGETTAASPGDAVLCGVVARLGAVLDGPAEAVFESSIHGDTVVGSNRLAGGPAEAAEPARDGDSDEVECARCAHRVVPGCPDCDPGPADTASAPPRSPIEVAERAMFARRDAARQAAEAGAPEPALAAAARLVLAEWSRMHPSGYLAMYPAMDALRAALATAPVEAVLIGTYADPEFRAHQDHKHPVEGCGYCPEEEDR